MGNNIGKNIRKLRMRQQMSQDDLAPYLNICRQTLSNYEIGKRLPDIDMLIKLADIFDVSIDALVGRKR